jgi:DNA replication protein DnaC
MYCEKHGIEYEQKEVEVCGKKMHVGNCPVCDSEYEDEIQKKQDEIEENRKLDFYRQCNIEPIYFYSTLDGFTADTPELVKAKETVQKLIETQTGKIVMLGKNGTGKTHLAVCAIKALGGKIYTMYEISTRIRATYTAKAKEDELEVTDELARVKMLAIDEIGRTKGSEAEENWLSYIIDKRNSRSLPLILISNKHARKSCTENGCKDCLENYLSEDIMSRLCVDGKILNFTGDDYRKRR